MTTGQSSGVKRHAGARPSVAVVLVWVYVQESVTSSVVCILSVKREGLCAAAARGSVSAEMTNGTDMSTGTDTTTSTRSTRISTGTGTGPNSTRIGTSTSTSAVTHADMHTCAR
jgi:hypothetical protein